ncbi:hypothetical protein HDF26_002303 [Pedobacter cryoconitis]|uniref:hypothetical protein n=1 Tax=Pedobacter cryoconitis TaxID=188932 RepID=UPI0016163F8B|nr:hypothetical protein [Pedobacter cryoconitis]MBB6271846.1 hypothetical protein [Pedobacter cryoconitis]
MEEKPIRIGVGYLRVEDLTNESDLQSKMRQIEQYCSSNNILIPGVFADNIKGTEHFNGPSWLELEKTFPQTAGFLHTIIMLDNSMQMKNPGLYLLKEKELREKLGITIEIIGDKGHKQDLSKGLNLN